MVLSSLSAHAKLVVGYLWAGVCGSSRKAEPAAGAPHGTAARAGSEVQHQLGCAAARAADQHGLVARLHAVGQQVVPVLGNTLEHGCFAQSAGALHAAVLGVDARFQHHVQNGPVRWHLQALARKGVIELVSGTSRGIRLCNETVRSINAARGSQFSLPIPGLSQLVLPLVGRVAAGSPILAQEHVDQTYSVENSLFQHKPDYLLKVRGMSMRDAGIMDGDLLAVQSTKEAKNGQIVVARLGDDVTVKRFMRRQDQIELHAENPDYKTILVAPGEPFEIEGLAVGLIRNSFQI